MSELLAGRYEILEPIGRGAMGTVWRAWDTQLDRAVAVKELRLPDTVDADERREWYGRVGREARAAARLSHPGIVTVHDRFAGDDGRPWIVMELVEGTSLDALIREQGPLPGPRVAAIGRQMLDALTAAHAQGIVHRDVKPANVLLDGDRAVLTDFGIAALDGDATLTQSGVLLGTPAFMAPEQVHGQPATPRSDLWSLGATLYAAVEGRPPFAGPTHSAVFVAIATTEPPPPVNAGPLTGVLSGLLRKDPAARLDPDAVRAQLTALTTPDPPRPVSPPGSPPPAAAPGPPPVPPAPYPPRPARDRRPVWVAGIALGVVVVLAVAAGIAVKTLSGSGTSAAPTRSASPVPTQRTLMMTDGFISDVAFSPDGKTLAIADSYESGYAISLLDPAAGRTTAVLTQVATDRGQNLTMAFSPDGRTLATAGDGDGDIGVWDVATRRKTATLSDPSGYVVDSMAFSPDGKTLAAGVAKELGTTSRVRLWDVTGRRVTGTLPTDRGTMFVNGVDFSPDGATLAYTDESYVRLWDVRRRAQKATLDGHLKRLRSVDFSPDGRSLAVSGVDGGSDAAQIWDVAAKRITKRRSPGGAKASDFGTDIAYSPDGRHVATRGVSGADLDLWDTRGPASRTFHIFPDDDVITVAFSADGRFVAAGTQNGRLHLRRLG